VLLALAVQTPEIPVQVPIALLSGSLEEKLAKASSLGYDGVELITVEPASINRAGVKSLLSKHHLKISAIASGGMAFAAKLTLLHPDAATASLARRRLDEMIELAAELDASVVTVGSFRGRAVGDVKHSKKELADVLRRAGERAGERGVRLAVEPINRYEADLLNTADETLAFLREVDHPAVGVLLDTYHLNIEESSWTEPYCRVMAAGKLFYAHLGDNNRLAPGQGLIDFRSILCTLRDGGYGSWLSAELLGKPDPDTAARLTATAMRTWMSEVR
jgi:sugar phosphate isomerase/epimerase